MRKGQLLTIDALLSLVIVVMVIGVVMNTNDMIKAEITNLLDWYDRANIANNMLDVLTKNPGYPEDWEKNVSNVKMVGLRDKDYTFALDYEKIVVFNKSKDQMVDMLNQLARGKDFLFEIYISKFNVSVSGRFPRVYIANYTFVGRHGNTNIKIAGDPDGNKYFIVTYVKINKGGEEYINENITQLAKNQKIDLIVGDYLLLNLSVDTYIRAVNIVDPPEGLCDPELSKQNTCVVHLRPRTFLEVYVVSEGSELQLMLDNGDWTRLRLVGQGQIQITISNYDSTFPTLNSTYKSARDFLNAEEPFYWFSLINGTFENDMDKVRTSMSNSPWIEPVERVTVFPKFAYNLSSGPSAEEPLIYGFMRHNPLEGTSIKINVNSSTYGNLTLISQLGTEIRGLFVYGNSTDLNATLVWYENGNATLKGYVGINGTITIPFEELFGSSNTVNNLIGLWLYSLEGWGRRDVAIEVVPTIEYMLEPKFESTIIKLWVWDDR